MEQQVNEEQSVASGVDFQKNDGNHNDSVSCKLVENHEDMEKKRMEEVFENKKLRNMILGHLIKNPEPVLCADICSVRLVNKTWQRDATKLLFKNNQPLCHLQLNTQNSLNGTDYVQQHGGVKLLDHFTSTMSSCVDNIVPPFRLTIAKSFFREENHESFSNFLSNVCASKLVDLEISVPKKGSSMALVFPKTVSFPSLKKLALTFCKDGITPARRGPHGSNSHFVSFIQSILNGTEELSEISVICDKVKLPPVEIRYLTFPNSLTKLDVNFVLSINQLQGLVENPFPNLVHLAFKIGSRVLPDNLLFQILTNVRTTLRKLVLYGMTSSCIVPTEFSSLRFPMMERLRICEIHSVHVQLDPQTGPLQAVLPKLKDLKLKIQSGEMLRRWTDSSCFSGVTRLSLGWQISSVPVETDPCQMEGMRELHQAFPNLKSFLFSSTAAKAQEALRYVFEKMTQLTVLKIQVSSCQDSVDWDSVLLGQPVKVVSLLRANPDVLQNVILNENSNLPAIKNMTSLHTFVLGDSRNVSEKLSNQSTFSDLVFDRAILKMPNLKKAYLTSAFLASLDIKTRLRFSKTALGSTEVFFCAL